MSAEAATGGLDRMRVTVFEATGDAAVRAAVTEPDWQPFPEWEGRPLAGVHRADLLDLPRARVQLVHLRAGGHFVMHTSPELAFCQVVRGAGELRLPGGTGLAYRGPELFVFRPGSLHEWKQITVDTLLSVCLVPRPDEE